MDSKSPSSRRAWIEIEREVISIVIDNASPSSRRAWIEMLLMLPLWLPLLVALLAEGVDRNAASAELNPMAAVALLAEGVDRNDVRSAKYRKGV